MKSTYRILAYLIAALVVVQAGAIAWAFFGVTDWITNDNGVIDKAYLECDDCESIGLAEWGFAIHMFFVGLILIPLTSLILLIVSFFAKVPKGITLAAVVFGLVLLQVFVLPELSRSAGSGFGGLHGLNALVLMGIAIMAGQRASAAITAGPITPAPPATTPETPATAT